jgi:hypothetical protein
MAGVIGRGVTRLRVMTLLVCRWRHIRDGHLRLDAGIGNPKQVVRLCWWGPARYELTHRFRMRFCNVVDMKYFLDV